MNAARLLTRASFGLGAAGLLGAMLIDSSAVLGRHVGVPVLGSIELVEACVVLMASASLVGTTLGHGHASVHLLSQRLSPAGRSQLQRVSDVLSALFFGVLAVGSSIVASDLWDGDERTELLGLPLSPLRALWCASAFGIAVAFVAAAVRGSRAEEPR
ncbi:MAG TPA: TRAP transporter small permease [Polyangiales bacterium]|nr:TRAP transporter small permease [Polyangiales bacterium]